MLSLFFPYPALTFKTTRKKILIISDLHLGWELSLKEKGIHLPGQTQKIIQHLEKLIISYKPEKLIILGDVKNSITCFDFVEHTSINSFFRKIGNKVKIEVVRGNHDGNIEDVLPENVKIHPSTGIVVNNTGLFHGHTWPSPFLMKCKTIVMAHLHPRITFRDTANFKITRQVWIKAKCNGKELSRALIQKKGIKINETIEKTFLNRYNVKINTKQVLIMPSFNDMLGSKPINEPSLGEDVWKKTLISPIAKIGAVDILNAEIYLLDGTFVGNLNQLFRNYPSTS